MPATVALSPSQISEERFPIHCAGCGYCLGGLGRSGRCPECGASFSRRRRLYEEYGPDVFLSASPHLPEASRYQPLSTVALFLVGSLLWLAAIGLGLWYANGVIDVCSTLVVWSVSLAALGWWRHRSWRSHVPEARPAADPTATHGEEV